MATLQHNISGELTTELLAPGDNVNAPRLSITNTHASTTCTLDLYIEKSGTGTFYLLKGVSLPPGIPLVYSDIKFSNTTDEFGLYIKLTKGASETPSADIIIN